MSFVETLVYRDLRFFFSGVFECLGNQGLPATTVVIVAVVPTVVTAAIITFLVTLLCCSSARRAKMRKLEKSGECIPGINRRYVSHHAKLHGVGSVCCLSDFAIPKLELPFAKIELSLCYAYTVFIVCQSNAYRAKGELSDELSNN